MPAMYDYLKLKDTSLYYSLKGEGEPLILLHSAFTNLHVWDFQMDAFAQKYKVVCYDQRGYGKSDTPTAEFSYYEDLRALIEALGLKKVSIIASSFGGSVAIDFALKYPEYVKSLVLVGPALNGYRYPLGYLLQYIRFLMKLKSKGFDAAIESFISNPYWGYFFPSGDKKEKRDKVLEMVRNSGKAHSWEPRLAKILQPQANKRLNEIKVPTLIVLSDRESKFNIKAGEYIQQSICNSKKVVIPGCGHLPYVEEPEEFNRAVLEFLNDPLSFTI